MTFKISGMDYSGLVDSYSIKPRRITGSARGTLLNGDSVADLIKTKWDAVIGFSSSDEVAIGGLLTSLGAEYVQLTLSDPVTNTDLDGFYEPQVNQVEMAIDRGEATGTTSKTKRYWYGFSATFTQK